MKTPLQKLDYFLDLALIEKQLALVIYENEAQLQAVKDQLLSKAKIDAEKYARYGLSDAEPKFVEATDLLELKSVKTGTVLFYINKSNLTGIMEWLKRILPTFNEYRIVPGTSDTSRFVFVLDKNFYHTFSDKEQEQILAAFLPIFDFKNA